MARKKLEEPEKWITVNGQHLPVYKGGRIGAPGQTKPNSITLNKKATDNGYTQKDVDDVNNFLDKSDDFSGRWTKGGDAITIAHKGKDIATIKAWSDGYEIVGKVGSKFDKEQSYKSMKTALNAFSKVVSNSAKRADTNKKPYADFVEDYVKAHTKKGVKLTFDEYSELRSEAKKLYKQKNK